MIVKQNHCCVFKNVYRANILRKKRLQHRNHNRLRVTALVPVPRLTAGASRPRRKARERIDEAINKRSGRPGANDSSAGTFCWNIKVTSQIYARQATGKDSRFSSGNMRSGVDKSGALSSLFPRASRFGGKISRVRLSTKYIQAFSVVELMRGEICCCFTVRCNVGDWTTMESITFPITTFHHYCWARIR